MTTAGEAGIPRLETILSYVRVSILGTLPAGEVWSVNPVFDPEFEFPGPVNQASLDAATLAIANIGLGTNMKSLLSLQGVRTGARVEVRDDTTDALIATSIQGSTTPQAGTGALVMPLQSALVCSIRTDTPGASGRGRIYWPALGAVLTTSGRLSSPSTGTTVADFKTYFLAIRTALATNFPTIGFELAVRSKTTKTSPHAVRIQVGDVVDTQRRRRDVQLESYSAVAVP